LDVVAYQPKKVGVDETFDQVYNLISLLTCMSGVHYSISMKPHRLQQFTSQGAVAKRSHRPLYSFVVRCAHGLSDLLQNPPEVEKCHIHVRLVKSHCITLQDLDEFGTVRK